MQISERIIWIFSNAYIPKNDPFIDRQARVLFFSPVIFIFGLLRILQFYLMQKSTIKNIPDHLVVRTAAPHMHKNYFRLFNKHNNSEKFIYIDSFNKNQFTKIKKLSISSIFKEFYLTYRELIPAIAKLKKEEGRHSIAYLAMKALPIFSYFTCLLQELKKENAQIKIFSGGSDLILSSAILLKIETYYLSHGLRAPATLMTGKKIKPDPLKYNIVLPKFNFIYLFSNDEVMYYRQHGVTSKLCLYPYKKLNELHKKIIIFLNEHDCSMSFKDLAELVSLFKKHDYEIIMKLHPTYKGHFHKKFLNDRSIKIIDDQDASAFKLMPKEKPKFVAGWLSTTLCEAHRHGITPICLAKPLDSEYSTHQFIKKSIHWSESQKLLDNYLAENIDVFKTIKQD